MELTNKVIGWVVKVAGMIICAPVTWMVAGQVFGEYLLMQVAAVAVVEGVFLANWMSLEYDKSAAPEVKARYALTALAMYAGLWVLAWYHGEGAAGLVFRFALGAALLGAGWDTYVATWQKATERADRSIHNDWQVRRHARKLQREYAKAEISAEYQFKTAYLDAETAGGMRVTEAHRERLEAEAPSLAISGNGRKWQGWLAANNTRAEKKNSRKDAVAELLATNPYLSHSEVSRQTGIPVRTVSRYRRELEAEQPASNGNGFHDAEPIIGIDRYGGD